MRDLQDLSSGVCGPSTALFENEDGTRQYMTFAGQYSRVIGSFPRWVLAMESPVLESYYASLPSGMFTPKNDMESVPFDKIPQAALTNRKNPRHGLVLLLGEATSIYNGKVVAPSQTELHMILPSAIEFLKEYGIAPDKEKMLVGRKVWSYESDFKSRDVLAVSSHKASYLNPQVSGNKR